MPERIVNGVHVMSLRAVLVAVGVMVGGTVLAFLGWSNDLNTVRAQQDRLENRMQAQERLLDRIESKLDRLQQKAIQKP